jgi:hypothetical protein
MLIHIVSTVVSYQLLDRKLCISSVLQGFVLVHYSRSIVIY